MPFGIAVGTDHVLVSVALEVHHIVIFFELIELNVQEDPDTMSNVGEAGCAGGRGCTGGKGAIW